MNVPFTLHDSQLDGLFLSESSAAGLLALKGHKAVGRMRASIYNAMPLEGVLALTDFMSDSLQDAMVERRSVLTRLHHCPRQ